LQVEAGMARVQNAIGSFAVLATGNGEVPGAAKNVWAPDQHQPQEFQHNTRGIEGQAGAQSVSGAGNRVVGAVVSEESLSGVAKVQRGGFHRGQDDNVWDRRLLPPDTGKGFKSARSARFQTPAGVRKKMRIERGGSTSPGQRQKQVKISHSVRRALPLEPDSHCKAAKQQQNKGSISPMEPGLFPMAFGCLLTGPSRPSPESVSEVATELSSMLVSGRCSLTVMVQGFEAAFLACAIPGPSQNFRQENVAPASTVEGTLGWSGKDLHFDAQLEQQTYTQVWCSEANIAHRTVSNLVECAVLVEKDASVSLLEPLRTRLHELAVKVHPEGHVPLYDNEAAVLCSALASICRRQGCVEVRSPYIQALVVFGAVCMNHCLH
jgi:hypothetical protein